MDVKSSHTLELTRILEQLQEYCAFSGSKELAASLKPTCDHDLALRRLAETTEARLLLSMNPGATIGGARNVRSELHDARRGILLEPSQFLDIKNTLIAARHQIRFFEKECESYPVLAALTSNLELPPGLIDRISRTMDERGQILDEASKKLKSIRGENKVVHSRLLSKLERLVNDTAKAKLLQESIITQRDGRYVVPLKADYKGRIKGIIHDRSASGATLFIEPSSVVELNNQIRELELEERDEIRRILSELTSAVADHSQLIFIAVDALASLDFALARARYANSIDANEPILHPAVPGGEIVFRLIGARHPLLDPDQVVPVDLKLDPGVRALIITGPNTGGKTVTLKTAGLLALMAQCGLHIPAVSGSELSMFSDVFADIGDEQSIEQSLSTFSGHIANITRILENSDEHSMVLLDELGAGTDPQEGAALAQALLSTFLERQCLTLIATHYPELKGFAHTTGGVQNASLEFDLDSLQPTYRLILGLPGRSNALAIAERLGLDSTVIEEARSLLNPDELRTEGLLDEIMRQRDEAEKSTLAARNAEEAAQHNQRKLAQRLEEIEAERASILEQAQQEASGQINQIRAELADLRRQLRNAREPLEAVKELEKKAEILEEKAQPEKPHKPRTPRPRPFKEGDRVYIKTIDTAGTISSLDGSQAEIQVGQLRIRARLDELNFPNSPPPEKPVRKQPSKDSAGKRPQIKVPPMEIDLRGHTVDDALEEIEKHFDNAYLVNMPYLTIIHGKGSGRLRQAIRQWLKSSRYVKSFSSGGENEGGDGVTVVKFKSS